MKNSNPLNHISVLFFSFVAIIVIINLFTTNQYGRSNREVTELFEQDYILSYYQLHQILQNEREDFLLVDLRDEESFAAGHLPGAINVPFEDLLEKRPLRAIRRSAGNTPVLYADNESTAHAARMLLLGKGLDPDIKVMGGDYRKAMEFAAETFKPAYYGYRDEKARFDYRRFMNTGVAADREPRDTPPGIIPAVREETLSAQGGC